MPVLGQLIGAVRAPKTSEQIVVSSSGISLDFTTTAGRSFILQHDLNTIDLWWQMFITSTPEPRQVIPDDVVVISPNHVRIELQTPMDGTINIVRI